MKEVLEKAWEGKLSPLDTLIGLVHFMRPGRWQTAADSELHLKELNKIIQDNPHLAQALRSSFMGLLSGTRHMDLLASSGILANKGFFSGAMLKISYKIFPPVPNPQELHDSLYMIFNRSNDYMWLNSISFETWDEFLSILIPDSELKELPPFLEKSLLEALLFISHRVSALGIEPMFTNLSTDLENSDSPFIMLSSEISTFVKSMKIKELDLDSELERMRILLDTCDAELERMRSVRESEGTSLNLTYLSLRMKKSLDRMRMLISLFDLNEEPLRIRRRLLRFFIDSVRNENVRYNLSEHIKGNVELLAFQITDNAGKTGEHYITSSKKEYDEMFRSAAKGGFLVAFMTIIKTFVYYMSLAPFSRAFLYSMNYSFGFIGVHLMHGTIATKQPAMTASHLASALDSKNGNSDDLGELSALIVKVSRSQFVAFLGNLIVVFPLALVIAFIWHFFTGNHVADPEKAAHMIHEIDPLHSLSIFHAGIAGVCLFASGLISGYYDNIVRFRKIPQRVAYHPLMVKLLKGRWRKKIALYLEDNTGSLAGNFFLGIFLGSMGIVGSFFGWPIDIRHVTISSGNFGIALVVLNFDIGWREAILSVLGLVGIGMMNFAVSFGLALFVAIRSRGVQFGKSKQLLKLLYLHFKNAPLDFIRPPRNTVKE